MACGLLFALPIVCNSCGDKSSSVDSAAVALLQEAQNAYDAGDTGTAKVLVDSLTKNYVTDVVTSSEGLYLSTLIDAKAMANELVQVDSVLAKDAPVEANLKGSFQYVKTGDMVEGYTIDKALAGMDLVSSTAIVPRIDQLGKVYVYAISTGGSVGANRLVASSGGKSASTEIVPYDGNTNYRFTNEGSTIEMITFHPDKCEAFCEFIANASRPVKVSFVGKSSKAFTLPANVQAAFKRTYNYSRVSSSVKKANARKIYLTESERINKAQQLRARQFADSIAGVAK